MLSQVSETLSMNMVTDLLYVTSEYTMTIQNVNRICVG